MKKKKKKLNARLKALSLEMLIKGVIPGIIVYFIISHGKVVALGVIAMMHEFLNTQIDMLWLMLAILISIWILAVIAKKVWIVFPERLKLPRVDKAITVEAGPEWRMPRFPTINKDYDDFPHLFFYIRVVNRTYYSFEPEEVAIKCCCGKEDVYQGKWDRETGVSETFKEVSDLSKFNDGHIVYHVPIKKLYGDLKKWKLKGVVKYRRVKEPFVVNDNRYANLEIDIRVEYALMDSQVLELKEEVEKALGDKR